MIMPPQLQRTLDRSSGDPGRYRAGVSACAWHPEVGHILTSERKNSVQLKDKIVFVTGASAGIGEACAEAFAR